MKFALLSLAGALLLLGGCQTPQTFPTPTAQWQTLTGQARYAGARSIVGEVVVRRQGTQELQLSFASGPGFPLLQLKESGSRARAEGLLARGSWQGDPRRAPANLNGWINLREILNKVPPGGGRFTAAGPAGAGRGPEVPAGGGAQTWTATAEVRGGRLQHLAVDFAGGSLTLHFSR